MSCFAMGIPHGIEPLLNILSLLEPLHLSQLESLPKSVIRSLNWKSDSQQNSLYLVMFAFAVKSERVGNQQLHLLLG